MARLPLPWLADMQDDHDVEQRVAARVAVRLERIHDLLRPNVAAEHPKMDVDAVCELIAVFFSGVCIELNLSPSPGFTAQNISNLMTMLRSI